MFRREEIHAFFCFKKHETRCSQSRLIVFNCPQITGYYAQSKFFESPAIMFFICITNPKDSARLSGITIKKQQNGIS